MTRNGIQRRGVSELMVMPPREVVRPARERLKALVDQPPDIDEVERCRRRPPSTVADSRIPSKIPVERLGLPAAVVVGCEERPTFPQRFDPRGE